MSHEKLSAIAEMRHHRSNAYEDIGELGRYPRAVPIDRARITEAAAKARADANLLLQMERELSALAEEL